MRTTRSKSKEIATNLIESGRNTDVSPQSTGPILKALTPTPSTTKLPATLLVRDTRLSNRDHKLLQLKQRRLRLEFPDHQVEYAGEPSLVNAAAATLVFAQEAAGTAVCISPDGLLLTCSHCIAESLEDLEREYADKGTTRRWLLFSSGQVVLAELIRKAWDNRRDLALLSIVAAQDPSGQIAGTASLFPFVSLSASAPRLKDNLICIGHPGSEDLEAATPGLPTDYDVLHISEGKFRGHEGGQNLQDNSEIGASKHDCWTYWGHSGAPLVSRQTGTLVGLHSSWDDEIGMRRGIALEAVKEFLDQHTAVAID
ncbi:MAG: hypothetical protein M1820_007214 [Bogoriella megaspora]|nr:MAG: hypothetical protein M1820_007214 [Bogoriella megaspora]